jgi:ketosteroid isomerase-like protein
VTEGPHVSAAEVMQRYRGAAARGDFDAAFGMFADDVVFRIPGTSEWAGEHRGRDAAMRYIDHARGIGTGVSVQVIDQLVSDERFCLLVEERFHFDGADDVVIRRANVYRVRGDEIAEVWIFEGDQAAVDALLAG